MIEAIMLTAIGLPVFFLCFAIVGCATFAVVDALSALRGGAEGSRKIRKLMARRWPE